MKKVLLILFIILSVIDVYGQNIPSEEMSAMDRFFNYPELAISRLTEAALERSVSVEALMLEREILREDLQLARKDIMNNISVVGDYLYGNLGIIGVGDGGPPLGLGGGVAGRYSAGIRLALPIDRLVSRHNRINRAELLVKQAEFNQKNREDEISQLIIQMYQEVVLSKRMLTVHTEAKESVSINRQMAEKRFREGQIMLSDLSVINESYTRANIEYETSYTNFETSLRLLEEVAGVRIPELMSR